MSNYPQYLVLLIICVFSRLISTIYYIEDPDSLRFALAVFDQYDLASLQPHFPGYPVFCFIAKALYFLTGNFSISFSIIGGVSLFFIIYYLLRLLSLPLLSLEGILVTLFIFFNPMIWIMSNRFMPDLAGLAVMIAAFYYLIPDSYRTNDIYRGWFLTGILAGVRLSYMPFLIIPCFYAFFTRKKYFLSLAFFISGIIVWLLPMILHSGGLSELIQLGIVQTKGHFYDFGGTMFTENNWVMRILRMIQAIWADGLGGYWIDRNFALVFNSVGIILTLIFGFFIMLSFNHPRQKILVLLLSCALYALWVLFFQNIIYNSRHILPLIPFLSILIAYGIIYFLVNFNFLYVKVLMLTFLLFNIFLTVVLAVQHTYPTAVAQVKDYLINKSITDDKLTIVSIPLVNDFLEAQRVNALFIPVHQDSIQEAKTRIRSLKQEKQRFIMIGDLNGLISDKPVNRLHFHHNPYVNRVWFDLNVYEYNLNE
jgi:hypothetical protein